jgi:hypothetical protein
MTDPSQTYQAYLLRLWRPKETAPWRATLVGVEDGEQRHFPDLHSFSAHLLKETQTEPAADKCKQPAVDRERTP